MVYIQFCKCIYMCVYMSMQPCVCVLYALCQDCFVLNHSMPVVLPP